MILTVTEVTPPALLTMQKVSTKECKKKLHCMFSVFICDALQRAQKAAPGFTYIASDLHQSRCKRFGRIPMCCELKVFFFFSVNK